MQCLLRSICPRNQFLSLPSVRKLTLEDNIMRRRGGGEKGDVNGKNNILKCNLLRIKSRRVCVAYAYFVILK